MIVKAIDVETTAIPKFLPWIPGSYLVSVSIATEDNGNRSWLINHPEATKSHRQCQEEIQHEISTANKLVGHNLKFDLHWLNSFNLDTSKTQLYCTQVAEYDIRRQRIERGLKLNDLAEYYKLPLKLDQVKMYWDDGKETDEVPANILCEYSEWDCELALQIYHKQVPQIKELGIQTIIGLDMEFLRSLCDIERNGMLVDAGMLKQYSIEYGEKIKVADEKLHNFLGNINLGSGDQLSASLYGGTVKQDGVEKTERILKGGVIKCGTRKCKVNVRIEGEGFIPLKGTECKKEGVYSTSAPTLQSLVAKTKRQKEIISLILDRAKLTKMKSTYFDGLLDKVVGGHVHSSMNQCVTITGRLSSSNPNNQNLPRGTTGPAKMPFISRY